jgi:nucleotidyltransferase AbiEii toxin of type IV toxin-antitoxin system
VTKPAPKNLPASVRQKLANLARERNVDFGLILVKYGLERILFRLSRSRHRDVFILKGALLFELWTEQCYRPTRDADFLAHGDNAPELFAHIFRELCVLEVARTACASTPRPSKPNAYPRMPTTQVSG